MSEFRHSYEKSYTKENIMLVDYILIMIAVLSIVVGTFITMVKAMWTMITFPMGIAFIAIAIVVLRISEKNDIGRYVGIAFILVGLLLIGIGGVILKFGLDFFLQYGIPSISFLIFGTLGLCFLIYGNRAKDNLFIVMGVAFLFTALISVGVGVAVAMLL